MFLFLWTQTDLERSLLLFIFEPFNLVLRWLMSVGDVTSIDTAMLVIVETGSLCLGRTAL